MASFSYRAVDASGRVAVGRIEAGSRPQAVAGVRRLGATPIELVETVERKEAGVRRVDGKTRAAVAKAIGDLAVLLDAGLMLDRALALAIENVEHAPTRAELVEMLASVREGATLSRAMAQRGVLFSDMAQAMAEAGEANGRLGEALGRLADTLNQAEDLRQLITSSMIYPAMLLVISIGVILLMLLFVVPQFESLFATAQGTLPAASLAVMAASRMLRDYGWLLVLGLMIGIPAAWQIARRPSVRQAIDRLMLRLPQIGTLVRFIDTARFSRTLGVLIDGEVPLPAALGMARRSITNSAIASAVGRVAAGVKEGGGLTAPLAAAGVLPKLAIGFFRTGEETSQLGPMLERLADVLDREVKLRLQRLIGILTPAITVVLGAVVALIIASIMTAILGFNDLAVAQ
jgi:general secretion pathway protein F